MDKLNILTESFKTKYEAFLTGCDSVENMGLWDRELLGEMDAYYTNDLLSVIIRLIARDGKISGKEVEYLNETFGFEYTQPELREVYDSCEEELGSKFDESFANGISYMRKVNYKLADAYKELLSLVCEIIIESDGAITDEERTEVKRLKEIADRR